MLNLYPDPGLSSGQYSGFGTVISLDGDSLLFSGTAGAMDLWGFEGALEADFFDRMAVGGQYKVSLFGGDYISGGASCKLGNGTLVNLGVSADGWTAPVTITMGSSRTVSFVLKALGTCSFRFKVDPDSITEEKPDGEAIRITTA